MNFVSLHCGFISQSTKDSNGGSRSTTELPSVGQPSTPAESRAGFVFVGNTEESAISTWTNTRARATRNLGKQCHQRGFSGQTGPNRRSGNVWMHCRTHCMSQVIHVSGPSISTKQNSGSPRSSSSGQGPRKITCVGCTTQHATSWEHFVATRCPSLTAARALPASSSHCTGAPKSKVSDNMKSETIHVWCFLTPFRICIDQRVFSPATLWTSRTT